MEKPSFQDIYALETQARNVRRQIRDLKSWNFDQREDFLKARTRLEEKEKELQGKASELRQKYEEIEEKEAWQKTLTLLKEQRPLMKLVVNGREIDVPESLEITLRYDPCNHEQTLNLAKFLMFRTNIENFRQLFAIWQSILNNSPSVYSSWYCPKCYEEKQSRLAKLRMRNDRPLGHLSWEIRFFR